MARVGEEFPLECPGCGGDIRLIAFITEPGPIRKILTHLGEPLEPPPVSPARGPPTDWGELVQAHDDRDVFQASLACLGNPDPVGMKVYCPTGKETFDDETTEEAPPRRDRGEAA
jgi:hypothetical protein